MNIKYIQINYDGKNINDIFPCKKENPELITVDSFQFNNLHGKIFEKSEDMIKDYINREINTNNKLGIYWDWIITKDGKLYKITPDEKAAHCSTFEYYSNRISVELPKYCPQYQNDLADFTKIPDQVIESICIETDNTSNGQPNNDQNKLFINLLAYLFKNKDLRPSSILTRSMLAKSENIKSHLGHMYYKNNISELVIASSYALIITKKENEIGINPTPLSIN